MSSNLSISARETSFEKESKKAGTKGRPEAYSAVHKIRFVTAASLFDGHDASINIMRRILQGSGAEVIHLGHNRSVKEVVDCAIQEDVQGIAVSSYQGGHMEYFKYMVDLLGEKGASHIKVFGGGGGVIIDKEIEELHDYGVARIFSVQDGSTMGLQGMINYMLEQCDFDTADVEPVDPRAILERNHKALGRCISALENSHDELIRFRDGVLRDAKGKEIESTRNGRPIPLIGITGTGGAGKSSLTDELVLRFLTEFSDIQIAVLSIDPSKIRTGGALLGDRIRMNSINNSERVYMRSMATRSSNRATSAAVRAAIQTCKTAGFDLIIVETSGIGQSDTEIVDVTDIPLYVMTHEYGAATQLEKINMLDAADLVVLNKFEKKGSLDALRDIRKQMKRNRGAWDTSPEKMPVYPTIAAQFNDEGVNRLFAALIQRVNDRYGMKWKPNIYTNSEPAENLQNQAIIPGKRQRYLSEVSDSLREYHAWAEEQAEIASRLDQVEGTSEQLEKWDPERKSDFQEKLVEMREHWLSKLDARPKAILEGWDELYDRYRQNTFKVKIRNKTIENELFRESLSGLQIPRIALPKTKNKGERLRFALKENLPGYFPFTAGVY
ncbi:MAG: cobalamin-dependent protein, partial [Balneolaceae bacterium]